MTEQFKLALLRGVEPGVVEKELKDRLHREQYEQDTGEKISAHRDGDIARALKGDDSK